MIIILLLSINYHILYFIIQKCTTAGSIQVMLKPVVKWWASCAQAVALYSVPKVPKQYPSSIQAVSRLVIQDMHKEWPSSTSVVYKVCPSSSSSVQGVPKLVHMLWRNSSCYKDRPSLHVHVEVLVCLMIIASVFTLCTVYRQGTPKQFQFMTRKKLSSSVFTLSLSCTCYIHGLTLLFFPNQRIPT